MKRSGDGYYLCDWCGFPTNSKHPTQLIGDTLAQDLCFESMCAVKCNDCAEADKLNPLSAKEDEVDMQNKLYGNMAELVKKDAK